MAVDQYIIDLINADIDGELNDADKKQLNDILSDDEEARTTHNDLSALLQTVDAVEPLTPPSHLRHGIMNQVAPSPASHKPMNFLKVLFDSPIPKYAMTFAAGVLLTLSVVSSDRTTSRAFDDVTGLVGTIANPVGSTLENSISVDNADIAGTVSLRSAGPILILDFDLVANGPVEIKADYPKHKVWFHGFGQLESDGTSVSAQAGNVTLGIEGKRRYAVYLHNGSTTDLTINLQFTAGGAVVHADSLSFKPGKP